MCNTWEQLLKSIPCITHGIFYTFKSRSARPNIIITISIVDVTNTHHVTLLLHLGILRFNNQSWVQWKENPHHVGVVIYLVVEKLVYIALDHLQTKIKC